MIEISLTRGMVAIVDDVDGDLAALSWYAHVAGKSTKQKPRFYAARSIVSDSGKQKLERLHRVIAMRMTNHTLTSRDDVDHIDGDRMNCRRSNLRVCNHMENMRNRSGPPSNGSTGLLGVNRRKGTPGKPWVAQLEVNGVKVLRQSFATKEEAVAARINAEHIHFGEFAPHFRKKDPA